MTTAADNDVVFIRSDELLSARIARHRIVERDLPRRVR